MSPRVRVDLTEIKRCQGYKCIATWGICRHHKGNDKYLGRFNRAIARDYDKYLDCVDLCPTCHCKVHFNYNLIMNTWPDWSPRGVRKLRRRLIRACDEWLAGKRKFKLPTASFKARFIGSYMEWRKTRETAKK